MGAVLVARPNGLPCPSYCHLLVPLPFTLAITCVPAPQRAATRDAREPQADVPGRWLPPPLHERNLHRDGACKHECMLLVGGNVS